MGVDLNSWFTTLNRCELITKKPTVTTCKRANRGDVGPDGVIVEKSFSSEVDDLRCLIWNRKPLALLHRLDSQMHECVEASGGRVLRSEVHGPVLVYLPRNEAKARVAASLLTRIAAWPNDSRFTSEHVSSVQLTEIQAHIGLGALLGYPICDLRGLHRALCTPSGELQCNTFFQDALIAINSFGQQLQKEARQLRSKLSCLYLQEMKAAMGILLPKSGK